jgi:hypothetical protein
MRSLSYTFLNPTERKLLMKINKPGVTKGKVKGFPQTIYVAGDEGADEFVPASHAPIEAYEEPYDPNDVENDDGRLVGIYVLNVVKRVKLTKTVTLEDVED